MTQYVLDTDILSLFLSGHLSVCERMLLVPTEQVAITIVTVEEILSGWHARIRRARSDSQVVRAYAALQGAMEFFRTVNVLPFDSHCAGRFGSLRQKHRRIGTNDLRIASIVLEHRGVLVTRNLVDYSDMNELTCDNWAD